MKIKGDFITNSSSTAYIMNIPDSFTSTDIDPSSKDYAELFEAYSEFCDDEEIPYHNFPKDLKHFIEEIKTRETMDIGRYSEDEKIRRISEFDIMIILKEFIVFSLETGGDFVSLVLNLNQPDNKAKLHKSLKGGDVGA